MSGSREMDKIIKERNRQLFRRPAIDGRDLLDNEANGRGRENGKGAGPDMDS